jgi:hypothetical protein
MSHISSSITGIINSLSPLFTVLTGYLIWRIVTPTIKLIGVGIGLIGAMILVFGREGLSLQGDVGYALLPIIATLCYGTNSNYVKRYFATTQPLYVTTLSIALIGVPALVVLGCTDIMQRLALPGAMLALGYIAILAVMSTVVGWLLFYRLVQRRTALFAASVTYLIPLVAIGWGLVDGEGLAAYQLLGLAFILLGVYFVSRTGKKNPPGLVEDSK